MNRLTKLLSLFSLCLFCVPLGLLSGLPAQASVAAAARLTPRNFVSSVDNTHTLTVRFDLANTGAGPATAAKIVAVSLLTSANQPVGTRINPVSLPSAVGDIPAGGSVPLSVRFSNVASGQRDKFSIAFGSNSSPGSSTGFYLTVPGQPAAPINLLGTHGDGVIDLSWTPPSGNVSYYNVKRSTVSGGPYTTLSTPGSVTGTTYQDTSVTNGVVYYYIVTAVSGNGESANSNQVAILAGFIGTGLVATPGDGSVTLTYDAILGAANYQVFYSTDGVNFYGLGYTGDVTTFTQTGLANGQTYYYYVMPYNNSGPGEPSDKVSALVSLPAPTNVAVTTGDGSATITWTASAYPGAANYQVFYSTDGTNFYGLGYAGNVTTFTQTGLTNDTKYYYYVVGYDNGGPSPNSAIVSATPHLPAPTHVKAMAGDSSVKLTWTASAFPGASNYQVFYSTDGVNFYGLGYAGNVTTFTHTGLTNRTKYYYYIVAYNSGGISPHSATVSATPDLPAPVNVKATAGDSSVTVTWSKVATATNYQVFYSTDGTNFYGLGYAGDTNTFTQAGLTNGTKYYYYVVAYNAGGSSLNSATVSATVSLGSPAGVSASAGDGSVTVTWSKVATATNYQVFYSADGTNFYGLGYAGDVATFTQTGLTNGTQYTYYVIAYNAGGPGPKSATASATPSLPAPTHVKATAGNGSVTITWTASAYPGAANYQVFYSTDGTNFYGLGYAGNVTTFTQTGLTNGQTYYYYVLPYNNGGVGTASATVSATPSSP